MFPVSKISYSFSLSRTKFNYLLNFSIAPFFKTILLIEIKKSPYFTTIFDESLNKKLQRGQMDILIRSWGEDNKKVDTRYFDSSFFGGAIATDIQEAFISGIKKLDKNNFLQTSSDRPKVNFKFLELMSENRETEELSPLIDIGTCRLHTVHNSLKAGIKSSRWIVGKVMKAMWKLLNESPARREKYVALAETNLFPLRFCGDRWCENEDCTERTELLWDGSVKFLKYLIALPKSRQPQGKSFTILMTH